MDDVSRVLSAYPGGLASAPRQPLGSRGGFSGALLWQLATPAGPLCLRAGAPAETRAHLAQRHALMARARAAGLAFVPAVLPAGHGGTVVEWAGRCWEVMDWARGVADFAACPTDARLRSAAAGLARLHLAWQDCGGAAGPVPAVRRRLEAARRYSPGGGRGGAEGDPLLVRLRQVLSLRVDEAVRRLRAWETFACAVQPCLRDVWHDHLLFEGDELTGLVDYAAVGPDGVAADLARMLGSLVQDDDARWGSALGAYRAVRPLSADEERLARVLDRTGVVCALATWAGRLAAGQATGVGRARVEGLLRRAAGW
jgi:Ser/Thr protein kinase RdoA (MazF antagonist)